MTKSRIHAHVESYARGCDGAISRTYTLLAEYWETDEVFRLHWQNHFSSQEHASITPDGDGFSVYRPTEEGCEAFDVKFCTEDDTDEPNTYRDHAAEAMGY